MTTIAGSKALYENQREFETEFAILMAGVFASIRRRINQAVQGDTIPPSATAALIRGAQDDVSAVLVGTTGVPITASGVGQSPYAQLLLKQVRSVEDAVLENHQRFITRRVDPDVLSWLKTANYAPKGPQYDPTHRWVDPRGYRLSDRIWKVDASARAALDRYLTYNIQAGTGAQQMLRELEALLLPHRTAVRTTRPYGVDVSFDAMRLARTEIGRAHMEMTFVAAQNNPFVTGMDFALSIRHPKVDICDKYASIGMSGQRLRPPYPLDSAPRPIQDTHPQCLCTARPFVDDEQTTILTLSERRQRGELPPVTPVDPQAFRQWVEG